MAVSSANRKNTPGLSEGAHIGREVRSARRNVRYNFLNATFQSIPGYVLSANEAAIVFGKPKDDISRLRNEVQSFMDKFGIVDEMPAIKGNYQRDVNDLFAFLKCHIPEDWYAECIRESGNDSPLKFVVYKFHKDFPDYTVWSMPISKLEAVDEKTRQLLLTTFAMLHRKDVYEYPEESYDMQYALGMLEYEWGDTDENGELRFDESVEYWDDGYKEWAIRYINGDIYELFQEIKFVEQSEIEGEGLLTDKLKGMVDEYRRDGYHNPVLLNLIEELIDLCNENWLTDFHLSMVRNEFGDDFANEEEPTGELRDFNRMFFFVYDNDDPICNSMVDMFNNDAGNLEVGCMCSYSFIDRDDIKERMEETFPERWSRVQCKFIDEISR